MSDDKCPKCNGDLYGTWHTNIPGSRIGREIDTLLCDMRRWGVEDYLVRQAEHHRPESIDNASWSEMRRWWDAFCDTDPAKSILKLATEYVGLRAENERLRAEVSAEQQNRVWLGKEASRLHDALESLLRQSSTENERLRNIVDKLLKAINEIGDKMFGAPDRTGGKSWRDARAEWWQDLDEP